MRGKKKIVKLIVKQAKMGKDEIRICEWVFNMNKEEIREILKSLKLLFKEKSDWNGRYFIVDLIESAYHSEFGRKLYKCRWFLTKKEKTLIIDNILKEIQKSKKSKVKNARIIIKLDPYFYKRIALIDFLKESGFSVESKEEEIHLWKNF